MTISLTSAIIAVKDGERFLREGIECVLAQDYGNVELIIVDGGSTDGTHEIIAAYPQAIRVDQKGRGVGGAWNEGVEASHGEYIAFLCHDDIWVPHKLSIQVRYLMEHPEVDFVVARATYFIQPGFPIPPGFRNELLEGDHVARIPPNLVAHRSVFKSIRFNPEYHFTEDVDWFARAKDAGLKMAVLPDVLLRIRVHDTNLTYTSADANKNLLRIMRESIHRQREKNESL